MTARVTKISSVKPNEFARSPAEMFFDPRIAWELAAQVADPQSMLAGYGYTGRDAFDLVVCPAFQRELKRHLEELSGAGLTYRKRAEIISDDVLAHAYDMITSKETPAAVKADMIKWVAKMADLEPKDKGQVNQAFQLNIVMSAPPL